MCFSATASLVTAGLTGTIGVISLTKVNHSRELLLAAMPIVFAVQQGIEGFLWLAIPLGPGGWNSSHWPLVFLIIAEVVWPVFAPTTMLLIEPNESRRLMMWLCLAAGIGVAVYRLSALLGQPHDAFIVNGHLVYITEHNYPNIAFVGYLAAISGPFIASSLRVPVVLESVPDHFVVLQSFLSMRRIEAQRRKASALAFRHSQSFASLRHRFSQPIVRSTIQRFGRTVKVFAVSLRLTISRFSCPSTRCRAALNCGPW